MNRSEKEQEVQRLAERFKKAELAVLTDYCGLNVSQMTALRRSMREANAQVKVVKNTLARLAIQNTPMQVLKDHFSGTLAAITTSGDPILPTQALMKFAKDVEKFSIKVGMLSGKLITRDEIKVLAELPSREQMLSSMLGSMLAPPQNLVRVLAAIPRKLATVWAAVRDKK